MINQQTTKQQPTLTILKDGTKEWWLNNKLHREDGPAVEYPDGTKWWYLNGKLHREDGPAVESPDGTKKWYLNNKIHREDGPAIENPDGKKEWYLNSYRIRSCPPNIKAKAAGELVEIEGQLGILFKKDTFVHIQLGEKEVVFVND